MGEILTAHKARKMQEDATARRIKAEKDKRRSEARAAANAKREKNRVAAQVKRNIVEIFEKEIAPKIKEMAEKNWNSVCILIDSLHYSEHSKLPTAQEAVERLPAEKRARAIHFVAFLKKKKYEARISTDSRFHSESRPNIVDGDPGYAAHYSVSVYLNISW